MTPGVMGAVEGDPCGPQGQPPDEGPTLEIEAVTRDGVTVARRLYSVRVNGQQTVATPEILPAGG